jgi:aminobenzoyl-glutamate transport protein
LTPAESRGLRFAGLGVVALLAVFALLLFPRWAPLRAPLADGWGPIIGDSPFMNGLIGLVILLFLVSGWCYGIGAGTVRTLSDVIKAMEKAVTSLGPTIFLFFMIAQFVAYFVYTNIGTVMALNLAGTISGVADTIGLVPLLLLFIIIVAFIDIFIVAAIAKWAIFAPVFVPLLMKLGVTPEAVLAAYRVGDSPMNALTPINAYFGLVVGFARKYDKNAGVGTVVAMMLPYFLWMQLLWMVMFAAWFLLGVPWGCE